MDNGRKIEINSGIFPCVIQVALGKPLPKDAIVESIHNLTPEMKFLT